MVTLPVYCCCDPRILLGTIEVEDRQCHAGQRVEFLVRYPLRYPEYTPDDRMVLVREDIVTLEVGLLTHERGGFSILAVKSMNHPLAVLRRLPTFREGLVSCAASRQN